MVPFPPMKWRYRDPDYDENRTHANLSSMAFAERPDGGGVLLPPIKEDLRKKKDWWERNVHSSLDYLVGAVKSSRAAPGYHALTTALRLIGIMKYKIKGAWTGE